MTASRLLRWIAIVCCALALITLLTPALLSWQAWIALALLLYILSAEVG